MIFLSSKNKLINLQTERILQLSQGRDRYFNHQKLEKKYGQKIQMLYIISQRMALSKGTTFNLFHFDLAPCH